MNIDERIRKNLAVKYRAAILLGILAGITYSIVSWGIDGFRLSQAHAVLPYLPFAIGAILCGLAGALAGFLTYRFNHFFASFLIWLVTGLWFGWVGNHMQVSLLPTGLRMLSPRVYALAQYPLNETIAASQLLVTAAVTGLCVIGGLLAVNQIEGVVESSGIVPAVFAILVWATIFGLAGFAVRDNLTEPLTSPVISADQHIQIGQANIGKSLDQKTATQLRMSAFRNIRDLLPRPYRLALIGYDDFLTSFTILVDFDGAQAQCVVFGKNISHCTR